MNGPIFLVAPPRSGSLLLLDALGKATGVQTAPGLIDTLIAASLGDRERLTASDVSPQLADALRSVAAHHKRLLDASALHALRVPFLHAIFPDAVFVYVYREPRRAIHDLDATDLTHEELAQRWNMMTETLLDDLEKLPAGRWMIAAYRDVTEQPQTAIAQIAAFLNIDWDGTLPRTPEAQETPQREVVDKLEEVDRVTRAVADRARDLFAKTPPRAVEPAPFRSVSTQTFPAILKSLGISLVISTYQSGRLIFVRAESPTTLNTHFRMFKSPMGVAIGNGRIAVGTEREVWDYRNMPTLSARLEPPGRHDACFIPRKVHVTGDIRIHEIGYASGELWLINTRFSALCSLDADSSFVPRWRPKFITHLAAEDRCHLNGMAISNDRVQFVTALGATNEAGGWREKKASGGLMLDVDSGEFVLHGLSMPHSPRLYDGRFFILESGKGTLATADLKTGRVETIVELPGFTRGLAFAGPFAFVGLSQVRESNIFGGIPLTERVAERECGVYVIDLRTGRVAAFLRFEGDVREIFDVQILRDTKYPELLELDAPLVASSYSVPDEMLSQFAT